MNALDAKTDSFDPAQPALRLTGVEFHAEALPHAERRLKRTRLL